MSKKVVTEVWILEEVMPYEGSEILGVYATATLAKQTHDKAAAVKRWYSTDAEGFTSRSGYSGGYAEYLIVHSYPVYAGKTP